MSLRPPLSEIPATSGISLDTALEHVVTELESDRPLDRESLLQQFPQWAEDLNQFIDNWLGMEQRTAALANAEVNLHLQSYDLNGQTIGDYQLLELISSGGMGVVYRAQQISLGRIVALKMVLNTVRDKMRFRIEAEAAASLHHANIVAIHEVGEFEGQPFLSMQYIAGGNLQDHLKTGPMAPRTAAALVRTIAIAVHYAHQRGVLHRDLKPANVLLDADRRPFVSDFGLAKQIGNSAELTRSGAIIGTPGYMAPEQAMGQVKSITVAADVYGLGAILYAALTGNAPFKTDSDLLTLRKVIEESPISPRAIRPDLDRNLETICLKCLEKSPASRYGSARQLADDLTRYLQGEPVVARPIGFIERRWRWCTRNPAMAVTAFFAGLMVAAVTLISLGFAWREYAARMNAKFAGVREAAMKEAVEAARIDANSKNQKAQQAISDLYTSNGLWAARNDLHGEALLWFAHAAKLDDVSPSDISDGKTRCSSWLSQCPKPIAALQLSNSLTAASFQGDWQNWLLSPTRPEVMFKSGDDFGIWNFSDNEIWRPTGHELPVRSAVWSKDGRQLALGCSSGELRILDSITKASRASVFLDGEVTRLVFSPSGKKLFASTPKEMVILTPRDLGAQQRMPLDAACLGARFSREDTKLLLLTGDRKVTVYDLSGEIPVKLTQVDCFLPDPTTFTQIFVPEFSADGTKMFVQTDGRRVRLVDCSSGKPLGPAVISGTISSIAFSPDMSSCASGGESYARLQSIDWRESIPTFARHECRLSHDDAVTSMVIGNNKLIATAGRDKVVHLWRVGNKSLPGKLYNERDRPLATLVHTGDVEGLFFDIDGSVLVTVQRDGLIRVWQIPNFEPPGYITKTTKGGSTLKVLNRNRWLIAGTTHWSGNIVNASLRRIKDGMVVAETPLNGLRERGHLLDSAITREQDKLISLHANPIRSSGTMLAQDLSAGSLQIWQFPDGRPIGPRIPLNAEPRSVVVHPDELKAAVLLVNREILLIDLVEPAIVATLNSSQKDQPLDRNTGTMPSRLRNGQLQFSQDGRLLFEWGIGKGVSVWNWAEEKPAFPNHFASDWSVRHLAISPAGDRFAIAIEESNRLALLDCSDGSILRVFDFTDKIRSIEFSATGQEIMVACEDHRARIFDLQREERRSRDLIHDKKVLDACYSPDRSSIATLTSDMRVYLWRERNGQWLACPMPAPEGTQEIAFSLDSKFILTMSMGSRLIRANELKVLDLNSHDDSHKLNLHYASSVGELVSAKSIGENGITTMTSAEWLQRWDKFNTEFLK